MGSCDFNAECFFLKETIFTGPITLRYIIDNYCDGDFTKCTICKAAKIHGFNKIPRYMFPNDDFVFLDRMLELIEFRNRD